MHRIERLRRDHAPAVLAFERENRAYFAASVPDRGDDYFTEFHERFHGLLAEQESGLCHFHVVVGDDDEVLGRVNLVDVADGAAELGFRIAEKATGRGLATTAVNELCVTAAQDYGLRELHASAAEDNAGSRAVLARVGFVPTGDEVVLSGLPGHRYLLSLAAFARPGPR
ncbi:GNAT family N-acetyltransferase [Actinophytocola sp. NPDC049390]|uniref:GNAT family N-acetyltransferase n=1 Tax=Actinophytocola sp. NPDC049390 TaxID=3363894 RepID=UPI0037ABF27C